MSTSQEKLSHIELTGDQEHGILGTSRMLVIAAALSIAGSIASGVKIAVETIFGHGAKWETIGNVAGGAFGVLLTLVFALLMISASRALQRVVSTDDDDQGRLMHAIHRLGQVFQLKVIVLLGSIAIGFVVGFVAVVVS